jgi:hypothetical protein
VLASYQALTVGPLQPDQALELVEDLFTSIGQTTLRLYTRALLAFSRDPFVAITRAGKRALEQYGSAWEFRIAETDNSFAMTATKCFYHDFFKAAAAPQLTRVFCRWDENWIGPSIRRSTTFCLSAQRPWDMVAMSAHSFPRGPKRAHD